MTPIPTVEQIEVWLESLGVSLWADWLVDAEDRRRLAAEWFRKQMIDLNFHMESVQPIMVGRLLWDDVHKRTYKVDL